MRFFLWFIPMLLASALSWADCADPVGVEGKMVYNSTHKVMQFCNGTNWISMASTFASGAWANNGGGDLYFDTGSVGIGTNSPAAMLDVSETSGKALQVSGGASGASIATFARTVGGQGLVNISSSGQHPSIGFDGEQANTAWAMGENLGTLQIGYGAANINSATKLVTFTNTDRLGVRTDSPNYTIHAVGHVAGTLSYVETSDARLKKDVQDIPYSLADVLKLRPVSFFWKKPKEGWEQGRQVGLIAQEVEKIVPEVVTTAEDDMKTKSLAYANLVPLLIKSVQELAAKNEALEKRLAAIEAKQ